jgi:deazaflavin-dependent oxidoreductase (nitroreductase family)
MSVRHIDPHADRGWFYRAHGRLVCTRLFRRLALTRAWGAVLWRIDRVLLRVTRGRISTASPVAVALLQTRGARSGRPRRNVVIYFHDGERVTVVASNAGRPGNPSWYYNVVANPDVMVGGEPFRAETVEDERERERLWQLADRVFPAFAAYRETAALTGRTIPIVQLSERQRESRDRQA